MAADLHDFATDGNDTARAGDSQHAIGRARHFSRTIASTRRQHRVILRQLIPRCLDDHIGRDAFFPSNSVHPAACPPTRRHERAS